MGSIRIPCYKEGGDDICRARTNAIQQLLRELVPEARNMAVSVMTEREIQAAGAPLPRSVNGGAILSAVDNYVSTIAPYISQIIKDADPEFQEGVNNFIDTSKKDGWFMLGSYYWTIARITEHTHELAGNLPTTTEANYARLMTNMWEDPAFAALWQTSEDASEKALAERRDAAGAGTEGVWAKVVEFVKQNLFPNSLSPVQIYAERLKNENALMILTDGYGALSGGRERIPGNRGDRRGSSGCSGGGRQQEYCFKHLDAGGFVSSRRRGKLSFKSCPGNSLYNNFCTFQRRGFACILSSGPALDTLDVCADRLAYFDSRNPLCRASMGRGPPHTRR
jgi:hypothetical protein